MLSVKFVRCSVCRVWYWPSIVTVSIFENKNYSIVIKKYSFIVPTVPIPTVTYCKKIAQQRFVVSCLVFQAEVKPFHTMRIDDCFSLWKDQYWLKRIDCNKFQWHFLGQCLCFLVRNNVHISYYQYTVRTKWMPHPWEYFFCFVNVRIVSRFVKFSSTAEKLCITWPKATARNAN